MRPFINSLLIGFLILSTSSLALPEVSASSTRQPLSALVSSSDLGVAFEVQIPWKNLVLETVFIDSREYTRISLPGLMHGSTPQSPEIPIFLENIAVPFGAALQLEVLPGKAHTRQLSAPLLPVLTQVLEWPLPSEDAGGVLFPTTRSEVIEDPAIYGSNASYPGILGEISNDGVIRQQRVVGLSLYPIQYQADTLELTIYEELRVRVTFTGKTNLSRTPEKGESSDYQAFFEQNLLNYDDTQDWLPAGDDARASIEQALPWMPPDPGWRIRVREDGFYSLTYEELEEAGLDVENLDPRTFQLFHLGNEVAIMVEGELDDSFALGDRIIFFGQSIKDKYTLDNVYWLTYGQQDGLRMPSRDVSPSGASNVAHYPELITLEENKSYVPLISGSDDLERFLGNFARAPIKPSFTTQFSLAAPADGSGHLSMLLFGYSDYSSINPDHHAIISLNGNVIADVTWDGLTWQAVDVALPVNYLLAGSNSLVISLPHDTGAPYDTVYLDWIKLAFDSHFVSTSNELVFSYETPGTWQFQVDDFCSTDLGGFDISDPAAVVRLENFLVQPDDLLYSLVFEDDLAGLATYHLAAESTYLPVWEIEADTPSNLQSELNEADHITISHAAFLDQAAGLTAFRAGQGLRSILVDVQDIYDEFAYGISGATPIRDFLAYAYTNWAGDAPSYVVLVGDGHYDPKNYYGFGRESYLPPYLAAADAGFGETAADNRYVTFIGEDTLPDMMLGRLAVNSPAEAQNFIDKIIAYEGSPTDQSWLSQVMVVSDNNDAAGTYIGSSQALINCCLPESYQPERIYLGVTHTAATARTAILAGINAGRLVVNYIGHAANSQWADEALFKNSDVPLLSNAGKYPIVLAMTCWEGYYINPQAQGGNYDALAEVVTKAQEKGAVASWSPTGVGLATGHDILNRGFFNATFKSMVATIGQATIAGKLDLWASGTYLDLIDTYLLFGDPALLFSPRFIALDDGYQDQEDQVLIVSTGEGVLSNDLHPQQVALSAVLVDDVTHGVLALDQDGSFTYTPEADYFGPDSFTYKANDGVQDSNIATVSISLTPVNDPPVAYNQSVSTVVNVPVGVTLVATDDEGGEISSSIQLTKVLYERSLTYNIKDPGPASGSLVFTAPDTVLYTPNQDFTGEDSFIFYVNDGEYNSNEATVSITISETINLYLPLILK